MTAGAPTDDQGEKRLRVSKAKSAAGGLPAVVASVRHGLDQMGPRRTVAALLRVNQPDGFDCPGCAWPDPGQASHVEFCENGAKAVAEEATLRRITPAFFAEHPVSELAERSDHWLGQQGRLTSPMYRPTGSDHYRPISWDGAYSVVAEALRRSGIPDRAVFYTSGRASNEAAFAYQLFARRLGTNNLPDCSNLCHESSGVALASTIGIGKGTVTLDDIAAAELVVVVGQNPGTNHPRMLSALEAAKRGGAAIVAINPLAEAGLIRFKNPQRPRGVIGRGTALADEHLPVTLGGDLALFQALNRRLVELDDAAGNVLDRTFLAGHVEGVDEAVEHLRSLDPAALLAAAGLTEHAEAVERVAQLLVDRDRIIICWAMGITQHRQAVATIREMVNTVLLRGSIGRAGSGLCPVRGHSNVQGDRTMGIYEQPAEAFLDALATEFAFEPPRHHGVDVVGAIGAMARGEVDVFVSLGGNLLSASPDTGATIDALAKVGLTVQISTKLNRSHVQGGEAALILPTLGRTEIDHSGGREQRVTVEDSMSMVHASRGTFAPASPDLRSEVTIVCEMAERALPVTTVDWAAMARDYDVIRDHVEAVVPGFTDFNRRIGVDGGFVLPNPPRDERRFATDTGRARLSCNQVEGRTLPDGRLVLQTIRSHDQYNTTIYGLDDRYRGIHQGRRVVFVHRQDLAERGRADGDHVDVVSEWTDGIERRARRFRLVAYDTPRGTCAAYFPEANVLVPLGSVALESNTPTFKSVVIRFEDPSPETDGRSRSHQSDGR
ncbi:MAG: FdhF/YdeP family oxidoreductase [Acidimicrobiales bacterium]